jgi:hypothetical protein
MSEASDRHEIGELLGYISKAEAAQGRPMLSSLVIHKDDYLSIGSGFYKAAKETGRMNPCDDRRVALVSGNAGTTVAEKRRRIACDDGGGAQRVLGCMPTRDLQASHQMDSSGRRLDSRNGVKAFSNLGRQRPQQLDGISNSGNL